MYTPRRIILHKQLDGFVSRDVVKIITHYDCISEEFEKNKKLYLRSMNHILHFNFSLKCKTVSYRIRDLMSVFEAAISREDKIRSVTRILNEIVAFLWWFNKRPMLKYEPLFATISKKLIILKSEGFPNADLFYTLIFYSPDYHLR